MLTEKEKEGIDGKIMPRTGGAAAMASGFHVFEQNMMKLNFQCHGGTSVIVLSRGLRAFPSL